MPEHMLIEQYDLPVPHNDLAKLESLLAREDVFTPSFRSDTPAEPYHALAYRRAEALEATKTILLPDRNLATRWVGAVRGDDIAQPHRVAAAVMAFAQSANMLIEPNLALYEGASHSGSDIANVELALFRTADNLSSKEWTDLALARIDSLSAAAIALATTAAPMPPQTINFAMPIRRWRRNYILALKLADLELRGGSSEARMAELLRWMYSDFLIGGPALVLAAHYLAPNAKRAGLIHGLRSPDRARALEGVRNVAWDLTFLSDWILRAQKQMPSNVVTVLGSLDRGLHNLARSLTFRSSRDHEISTLDGHPFTSLWDTATGQRLSRLFEKLKAASGDRSRQLHREAPPGFIDDFITSGEASVLKWRSEGRGA